MKKIFISGSISVKTIPNEVVNKINEIMQKKHRVLIGDAPGVDSAVQKILTQKKYTNVTVFCSGQKPRNNIGGWDVEKIKSTAAPNSRLFFTAKDKAMAKLCDHGLLIWDGKSNGTKRNFQQLQEYRKSSILYNCPSGRFEYTQKNTITASVFEKAASIAYDGFKKEDVFEFFDQTNKDIVEHIALFGELGIDQKDVWDTYEKWQEAGVEDDPDYTDDFSPSC